MWSRTYDDGTEVEIRLSIEIEWNYIGSRVEAEWKTSRVELKWK